MKMLENGAFRLLSHPTPVLFLALSLAAPNLPGQVATVVQGDSGSAALSGSGSIAGPASGTVSSRSAASMPIAGTPFLVGIDDVLSVSVWHEPDLSRSVSVRPDGKISLPLVGEIQASGRSVLDLQHEIRSSLSTFVKDPEVVVIVTEIRSQRINVIGQVARAGAFPLTQSMGVLDAIALAGGLKEFAKRKQIYVLRSTASGQRERLSYSYGDVLKGNASAKEIVLQPRDTVVVP